MSPKNSSRRPLRGVPDKTKPTRKARAARRKPAEHIPSPAERMQAIFTLYREHAYAVSRNPLMRDKTPLDGLKACRELTESLFHDAFERDGKQHVYLMLLYALQDIERQLQPLFDCARQVAEGQP